jgi:spermidine/putrescine-binding protein
MDRAPFEGMSFAEALSRRKFLTRAGVGASLMAAGPLLAACGSDDAGSSSGGSATATAPTRAEIGGDFDLYTWEGFDAPDATKAWRKAHGVTVKASYVGAQDDVQTRIKSPTGAGIDMSTVNQSYIDYYNDLGILTPITVDEVPALGNLFPEFDRAPWKADDGSFLAIPFSFGANALAYSPERLKFRNPDSWDVLFDPSLKNRVAVWDDAYFSMQLAAIIQGFDPDRLTHAELDTIKDWLAQLRPQVKVFAPSVGDFISVLASGEVDAVYNAWTATEIFIEGAPAKVVIPREGALGWLDSMFIPPKADNRATALGWAQTLMEGEVAARAQDALGGGVTVPSVVPLLSPPIRRLFPYDDLAGLFDQLGLPRGFPRGESEYVTADEVVAAWQEFKAS